jgi:hypothetical protein
LQIAEEAVELDPSNENSKLQLSELLLQQSKPSDLLEILKVDSDNLPTLSAQLRLTSLARMEIPLEEPDIWRKDMQKAVTLAPWEHKNWLGLAYMRLGADKPT